jgi:hypothetical protein
VLLAIGLALFGVSWLLNGRKLAPIHAERLGKR